MRKLQTMITDFERCTQLPLVAEHHNDASIATAHWVACEEHSRWQPRPLFHREGWRAVVVSDQTRTLTRCA